MAENTIKIKLKIDDQGNLSIVSKKAKAAADGLDRAAKSAQTADRNLKGVAQASSNSTKNFSKMAQGITGGLVPAYATLAANVFAITAAFQFLKSIGDLRSLEQSQIAYSRNTGQSLGLLTARVQEATGGLLKYREAAEAVSIGRAAGLTSSQIQGLAGVAKSASQALGRDLTDSFNRLTRGAIKAEPELLDELGIVIRLEKATNDYAAAIGKNAKDLTTWEKSQAVVNAVIAQGEEKFKDLNVEVNGFVKLGKAFDDLLNQLKRTLEPFAAFLASALVSNVEALAGAFLLLGANIAKGLAPAPKQFADFEDANKQLIKNLQKTIDPDTKTKTGKAVLAGEVGPQQMSRLKASLHAKNSAIFKADKELQAQAKRTILAMEAQNQAYIAKTTTGIKSAYASWRAELLLLQSEHGRTMGTMAAVAGSTGRFISAALSFLGWIGLAVTLFGIIKQIAEFFKSDEVKALEERANAAKSAFESQNEELGKLVDNLTEASGLLDSISQASNLISSFKFDNFSQIVEDLETAEARRNRRRERGRRQPDTVEVLPETLKAFESFIDSANLYRDAIDKTGISSEALVSVTSRLNQAFEDFNRTRSTENRTELVEATRAFLTEQEATNKLVSTSETAFNRLSGAAENYQKIVRDLGSKKTPLASLQDSLTDAESVLKEFVKSIEDGVYITGENIESVFGDKIGYISTLLGESFLEQLEGLSAQEALSKSITALQEKRAKFAEYEMKEATNRAALDLINFQTTQGLTSLQRERVDRENKLREYAIEMQMIREKQLLFEQNLIELSDEEIANQRLRLELLEAQSEELKLQADYGVQLTRIFSESFTQGFQTGIKDLITGKEGSLKDAIANLAQNVLESVAETLSKQFTDMLFGRKDPATRFAEAGEYVAGLISNAVQGVPPVAGGFASGAGSRLGGLANLIFGKKTQTFTSASTPGGAAIAQGVGSTRIGGVLNFIKSIFGFANGGVMKGGFRAYAQGGIATGPTMGLIGEGRYNEAVVPLPNGKAIPVDMRGSGQNNVTVNVSVDNQGNTSTNSQQDSAQAGNLGQAIARAVQLELQNQKRSGGILSPYGAA
jgi:hypothetical protein